MKEAFSLFYFRNPANEWFKKVIVVFVVVMICIIVILIVVLIYYFLTVKNFTLNVTNHNSHMNHVM